MNTAAAATDYSRLYGADCEAHSAAIDGALEDVKTDDGTFCTVLGEAVENAAFRQAMHKLYVYMVNRSRQGLNALQTAELARIACDIDLELEHAALAYAERTAQ